MLAQQNKKENGYSDYHVEKQFSGMDVHKIVNRIIVWKI